MSFMFVTGGRIPPSSASMITCPSMLLELSPFYKDMSPIELSTPRSKVTLGGSKEGYEFWKGTTGPIAGVSASALIPSQAWTLAFLWAPQAACVQATFVLVSPSWIRTQATLTWSLCDP